MSEVPTNILQDNFSSSNVNNIKESFFMKHKKLFLLAVLFFLLTFFLTRVILKPATVVVIGKGSLSAATATVEMTVSRVDSSPDPIVAINQGENNTKTLINEVTNILINPIVQRAFYQVNPTFVGNEKIYQVANVFKLISHEPAKTSELIKTLYTRGAVTITNVSFVPEDQEDVTQEARRLALRDAREQAKRIAKAAGKRVGRMVTITDDLNEAASTLSSQELGGDVMMADFVAAAPDKIEVSKVVSVTYEIW
jgi:uncharacterized protein YggE